MHVYIESVELTNTQGHNYLFVEFTKDINVIIGASFKGKSTIRRAIEWCLFNAKIDGMRKEGTKQTIVGIHLSNGVFLEKTRSASINRYVLIINGEEQVFDSINKSLPDEVKNAVGINPMVVDGEELWLNSAPQIALPFLFDKSPSWRMKLFNKLTGNDLLDKLFVQFNKDILRIGREHKSDTERLESLTEELDTKEIEKEQLEAIHSVVKDQIENLRKKQEDYDKRLALLDLQQTNDEQTIALKAQKTDVKYPEDVEIQALATKIEELDEKETLLTAVLSNETELSRVGVELSENAVQAIDTDELQSKIDRLDTLKKLLKDQDDVCDKDNFISIQIADLDFELQEDKKELDKLLESTEDCPLCGQVLSLDCKNKLKGKV